jgi:hypothetical protein
MFSFYKEMLLFDKLSDYQFFGEYAAPWNKLLSAVGSLYTIYRDFIFCIMYSELSVDIFSSTAVRN